MKPDPHLDFDAHNYIDLPPDPPDENAALDVPTATCGACDGTGYAGLGDIGEPCPACGGDGWIPYPREEEQPQ